MTDSTEKQILSELRQIRAMMDKLSKTVHGDGEDKPVGLVRRVDSLNFRVKFATWVLGTIFTAGAFGYFGHWFDGKTAAQQSAQIGK